jgi:hypothetical protein
MFVLKIQSVEKNSRQKISVQKDVLTPAGGRGLQFAIEPGQL